MIHTLKDENASIGGPKHTGSFRVGPGCVVRAKLAGLTCSFLFQPLPGTLGGLSHPAMPVQPGWVCLVKSTCGKPGGGYLSCLIARKHYSGSCRHMPGHYPHIPQVLLTLDLCPSLPLALSLPVSVREDCFWLSWVASSPPN